MQIRSLAFRAVFFLHLGLALATPLLQHHVEELGSTIQGPHSQHQRRQASNGTFIVSGVAGARVHPRLELRKMQEDPDLWNLYILGLRRFYDVDQDDKLSFYQISAIHGRPYGNWDGVPPAEDTDSPGYCLHVSNLFLTWHRPYLALYEQLIYEHVVEAANSFPAGSVRDRYLSAAVRFRVPYWEWAAVPPNGESVWPTVVTTPMISVTLPNGTANISNPLYAYNFHPNSPEDQVEDMFWDPFTQWNESKRYPTQPLTTFSQSQNELIGPVLDNLRNNLMNRLYNQFTYYDNFTLFSTSAWIDGDVQNADSAESIHDVIHNNVGQGGSLTYLDFSAYDPVFWLHHTMMDRVLALWQELHPEDYVQPRVASMESYTIPVGMTADANTPLAPFHKNANGDMYTSNDVRSTTTLGYTYPELANNATTASVKAALNALYGSPNAIAGGPIRRAQPISAAASRQQVETTPGEIVDGQYRHYVANVVSSKFAVHGSYSVYIFLGDVGKEEPHEWPLSANLVGSHSVFAALTKAGTRMRTAGMNSIKVTGAIPLTDSLLHKAAAGEVKSMDPDTVESYLRKNLQWRVAKMDGTTLNATDVSDLSITVVSARVDPAKSEDDFPAWSDFRELKTVTKGKVGGR